MKVTMLLALRLWLAVLGLLCAVTAVVCFFSGAGSALATKLYTFSPEEVTPLAVRLYGNWLLVVAGVSIVCAYNFYNEQLYHAALWSHSVLFSHFCFELAVARTMNISASLLPIIVVSGVTVLWMLMGLRHLRKALRHQHAS